MNTEDKMYMGSDVIEGYEDMQESVPCGQRPSVPREAECTCTGEPSETDILIADYQAQLDECRYVLKVAIEDVCECWKIIRELECRLNEAWWTKFCRWAKGEWEYNIYDYDHSR
jgi:hypothetical protein